MYIINVVFNSILFSYLLLGVDVVGCVVVELLVLCFCSWFLFDELWDLGGVCLGGVGVFILGLDGGCVW